MTIPVTTQTVPEGITQHVPFYRAIAVTVAVLSLAAWTVFGFMTWRSPLVVVSGICLMAAGLIVALATELVKPVVVPLRGSRAWAWLDEAVFVHASTGKEIHPLALCNYTADQVVRWRDLRGGLIRYAVALTGAGLLLGLYGIGYFTLA